VKELTTTPPKKEVSKMTETLKMIGGGIIIAAAVFVMLPGVMNYIAGLWRFFLLIALVVGAAIAFTLGSRKLAKLTNRNMDDDTED
jgi:UPF0716 family protein affecting phage T7 exclusion